MKAGIAPELPIAYSLLPKACFHISFVLYLPLPSMGEGQGEGRISQNY
jgi:hypothetical protein